MRYAGKELAEPFSAIYVYLQEVIVLLFLSAPTGSLSAWFGRAEFTQGSMQTYNVTCLQESVWVVCLLWS
ncbi:MAG: hypothetical protein KatS3mg105_1810 [Gemmatales bacterium]|nr:MAG: hypothetical protein KatS3mg105_1810 [Gemmatales bacterium]